MAAAVGADAEYVTSNKKLVNFRNPHYRAVIAALGAISQGWHARSVPWVKKGIRLMRQDELDGFGTWLREQQEILRGKANVLAVHRDSLVGEAQQQLGDLFNPSDYPGDLAGLYWVELDFPPLEPDERLRLASVAQYEEQMRRVAARFEAAVGAVQEEFVAEFTQVVSQLTESLTPREDGSVRRIRESTVQNVREFVGRFRTLNVTDSPQLEELIGRAEGLLDGRTRTDLRDSDQIREQIRQGAANILTALQPVIDTLPRKRRSLAVRAVSFTESPAQEVPAA
jgi:hypothetical protein